MQKIIFQAEVFKEGDALNEKKVCFRVIERK